MSLLLSPTLMIEFWKKMEHSKDVDLGILEELHCKTVLSQKLIRARLVTAFQISAFVKGTSSWTELNIYWVRRYI